MKLNKFKVGSILVILLSFALLLGIGPAAKSKTWEIDTNQFNDIEDAGSLSAYNSGKISAGDTLVLTETSDPYVQTGSSTIKIDVRNVTIKGNDTEDDYPLIERSGSNESDSFFGPNFLITAEGVSIENLRFTINGDGDVGFPAVVVDLSNTCSCTSPTAKFKNLTIPTCGSDNSYKEGILFTAGWPYKPSNDEYYNSRSGSTDYQNVVFENLTIGSGGGVTDYGIRFDQYTSDVSALDFSEMDISGCEGSDGINGNGIMFENQGTLSDVEIVNSYGTNHGIQGNTKGIVIDGSNVTEIADFNLKNVELKNNSEEGMLIEDGSDSNDNLKTIERLKFEGEDSEISGNGRGVLISNGGSGNIGANLSEITFEDALIKNNTNGGVAFYVDGVGYPGTEGSGLRVAHSEFNPQAPNQNNNDQEFGLKVDTTGGIRYVNIINSEFHGHGGSDTGINLSAGSNLENVLIENSSASYNSGTTEEGTKVGTGVDLSGNFVSNVNVKLTGGESIHFRENGQYGIHVSGSIGVDGFHLVDEDGDASRDIAVDENGDTGLKIKNNDRGNLTDLMVSSVSFDGNGGDGVNISTNQSGDISDVRIDDVSASENTGGSGVLIEAARSFKNGTDVVLLQDSELESNKSHGLHLQASRHLKNPRVEGNRFVDNNASGSSTGAGIKMDAGIDVGDELSGAKVNENVVTGNHHGIKLHGWKVDNLEISQNGQILDNGEFNIKVRALDTLQYVDVKDNVLINKIEDGEYGLHLSVDDDGASSNIVISGNSFESGITDYCGGSGTGIYLNAKNVTVKENLFYRLDPAIEVTQENSGPVDSPEESANHINDNNFEICCTTLDASALSTGQKVDATHNFWGEGETEDDVVNTIEGVEHVFYGDLRDNPVVIVSLLKVTSLKAVQDEPKVNETVDLEYKLKNVSDKTISGQDVRLTIKNPSGNVVISMPKEDVPELDAGDTYTNTHSFVPIKEGTYSATLEVDGGAYSRTTTFDVQGEPGPTPTPDNYTPDWDKTGIMPVPVDGSTPKLEITNEEGGAIEDTNVSDFTIKVFDLSGKKVIPADSFGNSIDDLSILNELENGLYMYTVTLETDDTYTSPVMKFVVKK